MTTAAVRIGVAAGLLGLSAVAAAAQVATYRNERHGFSLSFPAGAFAPDTESPSDDGRVFVSPDGRVRLLAGALPNADRVSLRDYRALLLQRSYPGAEVDYAPVRGTWFVLSGTMDGTMFYERVTFTCGGRLINSWAMLYPAAERQTWDPVVEQVARSYRPGEASCG
ncbi:MAG TPA: hypothetical protein VFA64_06460 [Hyphomicrobiaceae bacterium]|nr:hypothetical protein [Hyphomicrobiaceae bacterium]